MCRDTMTTATYKEKCLIVSFPQFKGLFYYNCGRKPGTQQVCMMLERQPKVLCLDQQAARVNQKRHWAWFQFLKPQCSPPVTHFLQKGHTYFNKATPPNSATPCGPIGAIFYSNTHRQFEHEENQATCLGMIGTPKALILKFQLVFGSLGLHTNCVMELLLG